MINGSALRRIAVAEAIDSHAYGLCYGIKQRVHHADCAMTWITANHLIRHLEQAGSVLMRTDLSPAPAIARMPPSVR